MKVKLLGNGLLSYFCVSLNQAGKLLYEVLLRQPIKFNHNRDWLTSMTQYDVRSYDRTNKSVLCVIRMRIVHDNMSSFDGMTGKKI